MATSASSSPLTDVEYLARSPHRVTALSTLAERPVDRAALRERTGVSQSTIRRTLRVFEDRNWVRRDGGQYEATELGAFVASGMAELLDRLQTERALRDVWHLLPTEANGFTVSLWSNAVVTTAEPAAPYRPVNRFLSLLRGADRFRFVGFGLATFEPCLAELRKWCHNGLDAEIIEPPDVVDCLRAKPAERSGNAVHSPGLTVRTHDDVPSYGFGRFDDRVALTGCDPDSGTVRVLVDTDDPTARDWVESRYQSFRRESTPLAVEPSTR
ncbi:MarR family transcriptional regulator [Halomicroarcula sp. F28]|uniref:helix-turn-helix transcriptional regulator n=1 Tax=Haloarcula salinisoli TaxID=2487746 RepID=UPI001C73B04C|nr:MarR family transcriptional regulator [Halomicroarcula salinisoli]MBX0285686.1 MarR family transcriptional regulator [Halomicroarcula salinisoli]